MDAIVEGPPDEGAQDLNLIDAGQWAPNGQLSNNSTFLYIAVEYVKDEFKIDQNSLINQHNENYDFEPQQQQPQQHHVSPLDPNMSSVAHYSPVYSDTSNEFNPIVIHQLVESDTTNGTVTTTATTQNDIINNLTTSLVESMPVLCNNDIRDVVGGQFLQMVTDNNATTTTTTVTDSVSLNSDSNQVTISNTDNNNGNSDNNDQQRQVELLITDQETGISYSVRSQEFLVERCLDDEQLLNALTPDPLLESDLLTLDENTLKTELNDDIINTSCIDTTNVINNYVTNLATTQADIKINHNNENQYKIETRRLKNLEIDFEDQLLSKVYSIIDKPVLSRARATLPETYLVFNKIDNNDNIGVFAKRMIPKRTQFGPLTGILTNFNENDFKEDVNNLIFLIRNDGDNIVNRLDVSDENVSNWMSFVRKAKTYNEQNLVISQEGNALYFTTTKNIPPKEELKVGYCLNYANRYKLTVLNQPEERTWQCFECIETFTTSEELQKHLNIHDNDDDNNNNNSNNNGDNDYVDNDNNNVKDENVKPRKKVNRNLKKKLTALQSKTNNSEALKCNNCNELFIQSGKLALRNHLIEKHLLTRFNSIDEHFSLVANYNKCDTCGAVFNTENLLKIHNYQHYPDNSDEQTNHICPSCQRKFPTQRQLVTHVSVHNLINKDAQQQQPPEKPETFKCTVCHKIFALRERLRRHMLVHGSDESKPLQCKTCNKRFLNNSALAGHLKTHFVGKKIFECPICKESFDHVLKLKLHVPKHCENNLYSCPHCTKVCKKYSMIRKHIRAFHCDQKHNCPHCTKMFPTLDKLKMHLLRHSDHREFLCSDCGKQFKRKDKLKEHCKRMHSEERENNIPKLNHNNNNNNNNRQQQVKKLNPKVEPTDFHRFIYKCHTCLIGFKRRGMLVNHLAKRHPDIPPDSVPELNLPILQTTRDYYCQHCDKVYKSSSKRKAHILKNHPGAALPMSNRKHGSYPDNTNLPNPTFSQTVGSITTRPQNCNWCHKQYASKAKLLQHQRKKHNEQLTQQLQQHEQPQHQQQQQQQNQEMKEINDIDEQNLINEYKVTEVNILDNALIKDYENGHDSDQYCHLVAIGTGDNFTTNDSHLYRLLTTSNEISGLVPPR